LKGVTTQLANYMQPRVNFTNVLCAAFTCGDPKIAKKTDGLTVFFALLGSVCVKGLRKCC